MADLDELLTIVSFARRDMTLASLQYGNLVGTPLLSTLAQQVIEYQVEYVVLDNVARIYGGNENDRHQVTQFVAMVSEACGDAGLCLIAHPGKATGSEYSGSTAWEGSVRARLYLGTKLPDETDTDEPTGDVRYLCRRKSNYSEKDWCRLEYRDGVLIPDSRPQAVRYGREYAQDAVLRAVRKLLEMSIHGNAGTRSPDYLPRLAKQYSLLDGLSEKQFGAAMRELMVAQRLKLAPMGQYPNRSPKMGLTAA
jgi:hypothetical protein